ncbi:unnamed protein product [Sympodiomycopsis kandeliae]
MASAVAGPSTLPSPSTSFRDFADSLAESKDVTLADRLASDEDSGILGLAIRFAQVCSERAAQSQASDTAGRSSRAFSEIGTSAGNGLEDGFGQEDYAQWILEARTWEIIHNLCADRYLHHPLDEEVHDADDETLQHNFYQTPLSAIQDILDRNRGLRELKIVRDWLSSQLPAVHIAEVRRGYMPFSKNRLRGEKRVQVGGGGSGAGRKSLAPGSAASNQQRAIKNLDPDAETRAEGKWDLEDANYAKALHRTLFEYARSGELAAAFDLARQTDQPWRAASLRGAMLYHRSIQSLNDDDDMNQGEDDMMDGDVGGSSGGNRNRLLWKAVCNKLAGNPSLDPFERALYGSLAGHLNSVLAVSELWEEHFWAYINAALETHIDSSFEKSADDETSWWGSTGGGSIKVIELKGASSVSTSKEVKSQNIKTELGDIFEKLKTTDKGQVHLSATDPYHIVQEAVILDKVSDLLISVESRLPAMRVSLEPQKYAQLVRFFSHLILYLRLLDQNLPSSTCNSILRNYVEVLEYAGEDQLVAMYASSLERESGEESYAHFLKSLNLDTSATERQAALLRAQEHALDMPAVARLVVQSIFAESVDALETTIMTSMMDPVAALSQDLTETEARLIWAVDWLTYDPSTAGDAIFQANALTRAFLSRSRLHAARTLIYNLPQNLVNNVQDIEDLRETDKIEFTHHRLFFEAFAALSSYTEVYSKNPVSHNASRMEIQSWKSGLSIAVENAKSAVLEILTRDWLKPWSEDEEQEEDLESSQNRDKELARIRQLYIPEMVLRLHFMLFDSKDLMPSSSDTLSALEYITKDLPILVADEGNKIFLEFVNHGGHGKGNRLKEYLEHVRIAWVESL